MADRCHAPFTMDCEAVVADSPTGGPEDWEMARQALAFILDRLQETLDRYDLTTRPATLALSAHELRASAPWVDVGRE